MQLDGNRIGEGMEMKASIMEHGSLGDFIRDDDEPLSYRYLEQKLRKWMDAGNVEKVVSYYRLVISKSFQKAPESLVLLTKNAKDYIRKELLL